MVIGIDARSLEGNKTGVGRYLENLLMFWRHQEKCHFFLFFKNETPRDQLLKARNFHLILNRSKSNFLFTHFVLPKLLKKYKCNVFFAPSYIAPLTIKIPFALTLHDIIYEARPDLYNWPSKADYFNLKIVSKLSAQKASVIFTPSEFTKSEIINYYKVDFSKIIVTPLAPDPRFSTYGYPASIYGSGTSIDYYATLRNRHYFIFVGACFDRRHIDKIIFAIEKLNKNGYDIFFLIAGPDLTRKRDVLKISQAINGSLGKEAIIYKPYIKTEDLILLYQKAVALIYLSDYEGFGLPVIESMAVGCPVITGPAKALIETAGESAIIINQGTVDEIYNKLKLLLDNNELRLSLIKKGFLRAKNFSWEKTAQKTLAEIMKLKNFN